MNSADTTQPVRKYWVSTTRLRRGRLTLTSDAPLRRFVLITGAGPDWVTLTPCDEPGERLTTVRVTKKRRMTLRPDFTQRAGFRDGGKLIALTQVVDDRPRITLLSADGLAAALVPWMQDTKNWPRRDGSRRD